MRWIYSRFLTTRILSITSGTKEELQVAGYLKMQCENMGVPTQIEGFRVAMGDIEEVHLYADGEEITCKAFPAAEAVWQKESCITCREQIQYRLQEPKTRLF